MDILADTLIKYGYAGIFLLLLVGIFGIPLADELLVASIGYLILHGELQLIPAALAVICGAMGGITVNYLAGRIVGVRLVLALASFVPKGPERLNRAQAWLARSGGAVLFLAYFSPGARHWAPVGAGIARMPPGVGALFAFPAAALWSLTFIGLGYHWGRGGAYLSQQILSPYLQVISGLVILSGFLGYFFLRTKRRPRWSLWFLPPNK